MVRNQTLLVAKLFSNISGTTRPFLKQMHNIPPRLVAEGFKENLVRFSWVFAHNMNYNSYYALLASVDNSPHLKREKGDTIEQAMPQKNPLYRQREYCFYQQILYLLPEHTALVLMAETTGGKCLAKDFWLYLQCDNFHQPK